MKWFWMGWSFAPRNGELMGKVIDFNEYVAVSEGMTVEGYRRQSDSMRAYARFRADHHRRQQDAAAERERLKPANE